MMVRTVAVLVSLIAASAPYAHENQPYTGEQARDIKALSPAQVKDLLAGRGMSLALAAELNGYPGPLHTLELAERLELTDEQHRMTVELHTRMQAEAARRGAELVAAERQLDRLFASRTADRQSLAAALDRIATLSAQLRQVHLEAHLEQTALLTRHQVALYGRLRGYGQGHRGH